MVALHFENSNSSCLGGDPSISISFLKSFTGRTKAFGLPFKKQFLRAGTVYLCVPFIYTVYSRIKQKRKRIIRESNEVE